MVVEQNNEASLDELFQSLTVPETDQQAQPQPNPSQAQPEPAPVVAPPAPEPVRTVPLPELLEQRHARQLAEQEARHAKERLAEIQRALEAQYRASQPQPQPIDPVSDPEGFARAVLQENAAIKQQLSEQAVHQRANMSEMLARRDHGTEKVDQAVQQAIQSGLNRHFMAQPDPYGALMDWHNSRHIAQQVGDLDAFRKKVREEVIAELKAGRSVPQNLPPSLSTATKANNSPEVVTEASDFFKSMFDKPRAS